MVRVVATGTFDILHPGHLFYFEEAKKLGDELIVIVSRKVNVTHKQKPLLPDEQRLKMVSALKIVDKAVLGDEKDIFAPIRELQPDIIVIGYNQHFDPEELREELRKRDLQAKVVKLDKSRPGELYSSTRTIESILKEKGGK